MLHKYLYRVKGWSAMIESQSYDSEEKSFGEFRRKVRSAELLSSSIQHLLRSIHFSGRLNVLVQNGQVLKSGYEEGYFLHRESAGARAQ